MVGGIQLALRACDTLWYVCFLQGDRGYEGPKGSRGPPGNGYKGDKVWRLVKGGWDCWHSQRCCKGRPVWPLICLTLRGTQELLGCRVWWGFQGQASKEKRQGQWKCSVICSPCLSFTYITTTFILLFYYFYVLMFHFRGTKGLLGLLVPEDHLDWV